MNQSWDGWKRKSGERKTRLLSFRQKTNGPSEINPHQSTRNHIVKRLCFCETISMPSIAYRTKRLTHCGRESLRWEVWSLNDDFWSSKYYLSVFTVRPMFQKVKNNQSSWDGLVILKTIWHKISWWKSTHPKYYYSIKMLSAEWHWQNFAIYMMWQSIGCWNKKKRLMLSCGNEWQGTDFSLGGFYFSTPSSQGKSLWFTHPFEWNLVH